MTVRVSCWRSWRISMVTLIWHKKGKTVAWPPLVTQAVTQWWNIDHSQEQLPSGNLDVCQCVCLSTLMVPELRFYNIPLINLIFLYEFSLLHYFLSTSSSLILPNSCPVKSNQLSKCYFYYIHYLSNSNIVSLLSTCLSPPLCQTLQLCQLLLQINYKVKINTYCAHILR